MPRKTSRKLGLFYDSLRLALVERFVPPLRTIGSQWPTVDRIASRPNIIFAALDVAPRAAF